MERGTAGVDVIPCPITWAEMKDEPKHQLLTFPLIISGELVSDLKCLG
jgi:hypothetical protein